MLVGGNCDEKDLVFSSVGLMHSSPLQGGWVGGWEGVRGVQTNDESSGQSFQDDQVTFGDFDQEH